MKSSMRLFRIAGIDVGVHYTWLFIFVLISVSLAAGFFPQNYPGWSTATYWTTGILAAILLFVSVLLHELAHSLVAQARGMEVSSITLFIFGGVSNLQEEPEKPRTEFFMAIVGPLTSLVLAGAFWGLMQPVSDPASPLAAMLGYLALINLILGIFNLLPGFPLDGGRVLRSILWGASENLLRATNIAATVGRVFGWTLIAAGIVQLLFTGNILGGIWLAFIGWFLSNAAESSRQQMNWQQQLIGTRVAELMDTEQETIRPDTPVADVVWDIFRKQRGRAVPVCEDDQLAGIVTITDVKELPQDRWEQTPVSRIMTRKPLYTVTPQDDLSEAMKLIAQHDLNQVLVVQGGRCVGMLTRAHIIRHLQINQELGIKSRR